MSQKMILPGLLDSDSCLTIPPCRVAKSLWSLLMQNRNAHQLIMQKGHPVYECPFLVPSFTPLESPSIYAGDGGRRNYQPLIKGGVKALPFLTGCTALSSQMLKKLH